MTAAAVTRLCLEVHAGGAAALLDARLTEARVALAWLGQAGFLLRHGPLRVLMDPYLSDHLARKYAGRIFPHQRMMPPPVTAEKVRDLTLVLCSHRHSDHMDPESLPILARNNPQCRFVVPRAEIESALKAGLTEDILLPVNRGEIIQVGDLSVEAMSSAHEQFKVNDRGEHHFLGFILRLAGYTIYHSGDCVVYDGLAEHLAARQVDLALLPVNGRRPELSREGVTGNMTFSEASGLCLAAGIRAMVAHHIGMFAFNTVDPGELQRGIAGLDGTKLHCTLPNVNCYYALSHPPS